MRSKGLLIFLFAPAIANAVNFSPFPSLHLQPVVTVLGGLANENASQTQTYTGTDGNLFIYNGRGERNTAGLAGLFLGVQSPLPYPAWLVQGGLEYIQYANTSVNGRHTVGIEPETSTHYDYHYGLQARQLLVMAKLISNYYKNFHPYIAVGLGAAFNTMGQFNVSTNETDSVNLTPTFRSDTYTTFSYSLGVGVDTAISEHVMLGFGYQFADLGEASLSNGAIQLNSYRFFVPFVLSVSHVYSNQLIAQISYLV